MTRIIALHGPTGVGKDLIARIIMHECAAERFAFADPVRAATQAAFGLTDEWLTDEYKTRVHPFWGLTPREMTQRVGTECFRCEFGADFWTKRLDIALKARQEPDLEYAIITDLRFPNELEWCRARGAHVVHVAGPQRRADVNTQHVSNVPLPFKPGTDRQIFNYTSIADLKTAVMQLLDQIEGNRYA